MTGALEVPPTLGGADRHLPVTALVGGTDTVRSVETQNPEVWDVAVVGAGACGLSAARSLAAQGRTVVVVDKGSRPGGRLAARRVGDTVVDTGATGVDTDDEVVVAELTAHADAEFGTDDHGESHWSFGGPANEVAARWLGNVPLRREQVTHLERGGDGTIAVVSDTTDGPVVARTVVLTAPGPQAISILARSGLASDGVLGSIDYAPALLLVATLDQPLVPGDAFAAGAIPDAGSPFEFVRPAGWGGSAPAVVATTRADWADDALDSDANLLTADLLVELRRLVPDRDVVAHDMKVWRYAHATATVAGDRFVHCEDEPAVLIAGDGFGPPGGRRSGIPRAVRSGLAVAAVCG
jgi:renalase